MSKRMIPPVLLSCGILLGTISTASAQSSGPLGGRAFVSVNGGVQIGSEDVASSTTYRVFNEEANVQAVQRVEGGPIVDAAGGYRVWRNLSLAVGYTRVTSSDAGLLSGTVPNPLLTNRPRSFSAEFPSLRSERQSVRVSLLWTEEVNDKIDVSVGAGPTFFDVKQTLPAAVEFGEATFPFDQVVIDRTFTVTEKEAGTGFHFDVGLSYKVLRNIAAVGFWRFTNGSVDLAVPTGFNMKIDVGGQQLGVGVRYRF